MTDYKLVPVEPTAEMMWAAQEADMDHSDHDEWLELDGDDCKRMYRAMLAAAPAVQGELVGYVNSDELDNILDDRTATIHPIRTGFHATPLYTAPQPAEQQPANPDDTATAILGDRMYIAGLKAGWNYAEAGDRAGFDRSIENGHREIRDAKQELAERRCEYCDGTGDVHSLDGEWRGTCSCPAGQQPAPDVAGLVEALEGLLPFVTSDSVECRGDKCREHWCLSCWDEETVRETVKNIRTAIAKADDALAAHRKQGGEK